MKAIEYKAQKRAYIKEIQEIIQEIDPVRLECVLTILKTMTRRGNNG